MYFCISVLFGQIDYFNNQIIVDLVEQQHKGIFAVLDEACMNVGKVTDEMFLQALNNKLAKHAHYTSRKVWPETQLVSRFSTQGFSSLAIQHYTHKLFFFKSVEVNKTNIA